VSSRIYRNLNQELCWLLVEGAPTQVILSGIRVFQWLASGINWLCELPFGTSNASLDVVLNRAANVTKTLLAKVHGLETSFVADRDANNPDDLEALKKLDASTLHVLERLFKNSLATIDPVPFTSLPVALTELKEEKKINIKQFELSAHVTFLVALQAWEAYPYVLLVRTKSTIAFLHEALLYCALFPAQSSTIHERLIEILKTVFDGELSLSNDQTLTSNGGEQWSILLQVVQTLMAVPKRPAFKMTETAFWSFLVAPNVKNRPLSSLVMSPSYAHVCRKVALAVLTHFGQITSLRVEQKKKKDDQEKDDKEKDDKEKDDKEKDDKEKDEEKEEKKEEKKEKVKFFVPAATRGRGGAEAPVRGGRGRGSARGRGGRPPPAGGKSKYKMVFRPEVVALLDLLTDASDPYVAFAALSSGVELNQFY